MRIDIVGMARVDCPGGKYWLIDNNIRDRMTTIAIQDVNNHLLTEVKVRLGTIVLVDGYDIMGKKNENHT